MPYAMPKVYEGDRDYVFACYAHDDRDAVLPMIAALADEGYRVWYDDGIELTGDYPEDIADHVFGCSCLVMFVSPGSLESDWCRQEVNYAIDLKKKILPIYLEDVELTRGLQMRMGNRQALFWYKCDTDEEFYRKLFRARRLDSCLTDEARRRRGVKPKGTATKVRDAAIEPGHARQVITVTDRPAIAHGVVPKGSLEEYSWAELKEISRLIAAAGSDAEWRAIARRHRLVDGGGRLRGETKGLTLSDGTRTSVRILGFRHDELAGDKGKAGISFEFADVPARRRMNPTVSNAGGWEGSEMCGWLNSEFLSLLPSDLRLLVEPTLKLTNNVGEVRRNNDTSVVGGTADRLWLLSMREVYGSLTAQGLATRWSPATYDAEGTQYQLYEDKNVTLSSFKPCKKQGARSW